MKKGLYLLISIFLIIVFNNYFNLTWGIFTSSVLSVFIAIALDYLEKYSLKFNLKTFLNALLFSIFIFIGLSYQIGGSITYFFKLSRIFYLILNLVLFTFLFYYLLNYLYYLFDKRIIFKKTKCILDKHPFLISFSIVLIISIFYLIFYYPGTMAYDGMWQLDFYYHTRLFSNHHPALLTLIMGFLMDIGRNLLNDNLGMFLFILPQVIINALVYAYVLKIMTKMDSPLILRFITLVFYALFPLLAINAITYIKDTLYYLVFLWFYVYFYYHFYLNEPTKTNYFILIIITIILYFLRNTGYYTVLFTFIPFIIYYLIKDKKNVKGFIIIVGVILVVNTFYHKVFLPKLDIKEASVREMLSIPLQQTARYLKYYPNDLSDNEQKVLDKVFTDDLINIGKVYNPNRSDNVKWKFKAYPSNKELKSYFKVWFTMFFKHPLVYLDATLNNTYGYFYPNVMNFINEELGFYYIEVKGPVNKGDIDIYWSDKTKKGRELLYKSSEDLSKTPIICLLYTPAFYVWILISVSIYLISKKNRILFLYLIPLYVVVLVCIISPVNGHMRYLQPILVTTPFLISMIFKEKINNEK